MALPHMQPKLGVISNNLCKPLLDSYGINISVEPALQSSLYTSDINIPPIGFEKWQFLRLDCSKRNGIPINITAISTYDLPYIIAMVNCTVVSSQTAITKETQTTSSPNEKGPADILFSGCTIKSDSIPTKRGVIIQSSTLPPKFYTRDISKLVMLSSRTLDSPFELFIDDKLVNLTVIGEPANPLEGNVHTQGVGIITRCILSRTKLASAVDSNPKVLQKCYGLKTKSTNATYVSEGLRSNIDMVVLTTFSLVAIAASKYDPKERLKPIASLSVSILSVYSSVCRILDSKLNIQQTPILLAVVSLLYTLHHWKVGRAYVKLAYFCLAIPALLNLALLFPDGQLGKTGYIIFMITLSIFTSTLIWVTKFTAEESRYPKFIFSLGPIVVIGIIALFVGLAPDIYEGQSYKGWISVMSFMNFVCLMTNVCYYSKVWEKNMENHCMKEEI